MRLPKCWVCGFVGTINSCRHIINDCRRDDHIGDYCYKCGDDSYLFSQQFKEEYIE